MCLNWWENYEAEMVVKIKVAFKIKRGIYSS